MDGITYEIQCLDVELETYFDDVKNVDFLIEVAEFLMKEDDRAVKKAQIRA